MKEIGGNVPDGPARRKNIHIESVLKINLNLNGLHVRERILALLVTEHMIDKVTEYVYDKQFSDMKNYHIVFLFHYYTFQMFLKTFYK